VTDHPIIFSAPMVRALLAGRKTMTRRVLYSARKARGGIVPASATVLNGYPPIACAAHFDISTYFALTGWQNLKAGDRLWVREAAAFITESFDQPDYWEYRADTNGHVFPGNWPDDEKDNPDRPRWRPSIHMPRAASRVTLIVTSTKIEPLRDISDIDAIAEGVLSWREGWSKKEAGLALLRSTEAAAATNNGTTAQRLFYLLWTSLHGSESWHANPFVVAPTFRVIKANIDAPEAAAA